MDKEQMFLDWLNFCISILLTLFVLLIISYFSHGIEWLFMNDTNTWTNISFSIGCGLMSFLILDSI